MSRGLNALARSVSITMLRLVIDFEIKLTEDAAEPKRTVLNIEETLRCSLEPWDQNTPMNLMGKADRIDLVGGRTRIIDYKTGQVALKTKKLPEPEILFSRPNKDNNKIIQLLCYSLMLYKSGTPAENIESALFSLRNYSAGYQSIKSENGEGLNAALLHDFEKKLRELFISILNCDAFEHNPESEFCEYCRS
jgi:hypothetical protein